MNEEYSAYLNSDAWKNKRLKRLAISQFRCSACTESEAVHVHHLTYARVFNEDMSDLMPLCEVCHRTAEALIKDGKLQRHGDVLFLTTETLRLIIPRKPNPRATPAPVLKIRGMIVKTCNSAQEQLMALPAFVNLLTRCTNRHEFKRDLRKLSRKGGLSKFKKGAAINNGCILWYRLHEMGKDYDYLIPAPVSPVRPTLLPNPTQDSGRLVRSNLRAFKRV